MTTRAPGTSVGGYVIESLLGAGGVSEVYAARHAFTGQPVALKVLQMRHVGNARLTELATAEATALSRIRHANLVPVTDAGITPEGVVWMVMPRLDGWTLREHLSRGRLDPSEALRIAIDLCDGVAAAHEEGIFHRDVKPENVFVTRRGEIVVLDLGMAKFHDYGVKSTGGGKIVGTVRYMSPEQILGKRLDVRTDVYSIGVVLHEMLSGEHPFQRGADGEPLTSYQVGMAHLTRPAPRLAGVPEALAALVASTLEKEPAGRPAGVAELARALRTLHRATGAAPGVPSARTYVPPRSLDEAETPPTVPRDRVVASVRPTSSARPTQPEAGHARPPAGDAPPGPLRLAATEQMAEGMPLPTPTAAPAPRAGRGPIALGIAVGALVAAALQLALHGARFP